MNMKKFVAPSSRDALRQVKNALGADAVILSNRKVDDGVEVLAVANRDAQALVSAAGQQPTAANASASSRSSPRRVRGDGPRTTFNWVPEAFRRSGPDAAGEEMAQQVIREIQSMRGVIESQLSGLVWGNLRNREPARAQLLRDLLLSGFSPRLSRGLAEKLPRGSAAEMTKWARAALVKNLLAADVDEIVNRGGIYALTGPTGVGKTTTTAKLAARCVVRHGADRLALLTTDSYRVGAHEHLRIYGRILGVTVHAARDAHELGAAITDLRGKHMVLIDTIGMSQRDKQVAEQVAMLSAAGKVRQLLLLNATCNGDTLEDVVRVYGCEGLAGCILTKVDEAVSIGPALDSIIRHRIRLHFIANGQRVPEDLHPVNRQYLVDRALRRAEQPVQEFGAAELAAMASSTSLAAAAA